MLAALKRDWSELKKGQPGRRFEDRCLRRRQKEGERWTPRKVLKALGGLLLVALGIVLVPAPGPGSATIIIGLALIADEFQPVAIFLDRSEVALRKLYDRLWKKAAFPQRALVTVIVLALAGFAAYGTYQVLV